MKKKGIVFVAICAFLFIALQPFVLANSEETPTTIAQQFKEVILPHLITFFVALSGTSIGNFIIKTIFQKSLNLLGFSKNELEGAVKAINASNLINEDTKKVMEEKLENALLSIKELEEKLISAQEELLKTKEDLKASQVMQVKTNEEILKVLEIAFLNDTELVRKGYAKEISKVLENGKELKKQA